MAVIIEYRTQSITVKSKPVLHLEMFVILKRYSVNGYELNLCYFQSDKIPIPQDLSLESTSCDEKQSKNR